MCARCLDVHYPERGRGGARVTAGIVLAFVGAGLSVLPWSCQALRATGIAE
jgi:hypothetical protein